MTSYMGKKERIPEYEAAVTALTRLLAVANADCVTRAFAEAVSEQRREDWAARHGLRQSAGHQCITRLTGRCVDRFNCTPPGGDHMSLWLKDGKPEAFVSQPYGLGWDKLVSIVSYCQRHGLEISIDSYPAWHFPGATLMVTYKRAKLDGSEVTR